MSELGDLPASDDELDSAEPSSTPDPAGKTDNLAGQPFDVTYAFPETVEIRLVDASGLLDYEVWFAIAALFSNFTIGFVIAYIESNDDGSLLTTALIFAALLVGAVGMAIAKRAKLRKKVRRFKGPPGSLTPVEQEPRD